MNAVLLVFLAILAPSDDGDKPRALREFERARSVERLRTVRAEILLTEPGEGYAGGDYRSFRSYESTGAHYRVTDTGNEDQIVALDADGKPIVGFGPMHVFVGDDGTWQREDSSVDIHVFNDQGRAFANTFDLRALGRNPWSFAKDIETFARESGLNDPKYSERREGNLYVVTADLGEAQAKWWIDPEKDWSVTRTQVLTADTVRIEQVFTIAYDKHDLIWFPSKVEEYRRAAGETTPSRVIEILGVEFNRPGHKPELTPADIGAEPGMWVLHQDEPSRTAQYWDGQRVISGEELRSRLDAGTLSLGMKVLKAYARARVRTESMSPAEMAKVLDEYNRGLPKRASVETFENDWEKYTREFIEKHKLDEEPTQRAWAICRECVDAGKTYAASVIEEIDSIDASLKQADDADSKLTAERQEKLRQRREKLHEPLGRIFAERLVPRLDRLVKPPAKP